MGNGASIGQTSLLRAVVKPVLSCTFQVWIATLRLPPFYHFLDRFVFWLSSSGQTTCKQVEMAHTFNLNAGLLESMLRFLHCWFIR